VVDPDFLAPRPRDPGSPSLAGAQPLQEAELEARTSLQLFQRIERLARRMKCDPSDIFREAIQRYLEAEEQRLRGER